MGIMEKLGFAACAQDETIIKYDSTSRKNNWMEKSTDYFVMTAGLHKKIAVGELFTTNGEQMFRTHEKFDAVSAVAFVEIARQKFGKKST